MHYVKKNGYTNYFKTIIETYPHSSAYRNPIYIVEGILICILAYLWLEYTQMDGTFKSVYPMIIAVIIVLSQFLIVEKGGRLVYKHWKPFIVNVRGFWLISFSGVFFGFLMVYFNAQCPGVEAFYPDIFYFYHDYPEPTPSRISVFYKIILIPWAVSCFLMVQGEIKKQLTRELENIRQINEGLEKKGKYRIPDSGKKEDKGKNLHNFSVPVKDGYIKIEYEDIYFISVQDHYCNLVYRKENKRQSALIRLSLKQAVEKLSSDSFEQVHRSHVVNLLHVQKIEKKGQTYQMLMRGIDDIIPASRHRAQSFLPRLKKFSS